MAIYLTLITVNIAKVDVPRTCIIIYNIQQLCYMESTGRPMWVVEDCGPESWIPVGWGGLGGGGLERYIPFSDQYLICQRTTEQDVTVNLFY